MPDPPHLRRRTAVLGAVGAALGSAALSGCDAEDLKPHDATPTTPVASTPTASAGQPTPDEQLVDGIAAAILTTLGTVVAARRVPALTTLLGPVVHTHRAHVEVLKQAARVPHVVGPKDGTAALNAVTTAESDLQSRLVDAAVQAESGTLAVLLASMSASISQLLAGPLLVFPGRP